MDRDIRDKVVVVTGGAEGLGYAIAESFLQRHAKNVIIVDVNKSKGKEAVDSLNAKYLPAKADFMKGDVNKDLDILSSKIFDKYKTVHCLVNNAGIVDEYSPRKVMEINTISLMEWTYKFLEHMRKDKGGNGGTILNMGSIYSFTIDSFSPVYKASKFAVMGFSKTLGHEQNYKMYGVRVVVLCPGFTYSKLTDNLHCCREEEVEEFQKYVTTLEWQSPEAVGKAAMKIFETADSGSAWSVINGNIKQVP